jgi:hypothetical protein
MLLPRKKTQRDRSKFPPLHSSKENGQRASENTTRAHFQKEPPGRWLSWMSSQRAYPTQTTLRLAWQQKSRTRNKKQAVMRFLLSHHRDGVRERLLCGVSAGLHPDKRSDAQALANARSCLRKSSENKKSRKRLGTRPDTARCKVAVCVAPSN